MTFDHFKAIVPLLVVVLSAILTGYIVPSITRDWQNYQKELELKTALVEGANVEVLSFLLGMQLAERRAIPQLELDKAYRIWEVQRAVLTGKLRLYFRDQTVSRDFDLFSEALTDFYVLAGVTNKEHRSKQIVKLKSYFGEAGTDWEILEDQELRTKDFFTWFFAWWKLRQVVLLRKDTVLSKVLKEPIVFSR